MERFNQVLKENRERYQNNLKKEIKRQERQNKKEFILFIFISLFILVISSIYIYNSDNSNYKNCMEKNNNENICMGVYE